MSLEGRLDAHSDGLWKASHLPVRIDDDVDGWTVGGGVKTKLDQRVSLKLEYRYSEFDGASAKVTDKDHDFWKHYPWKVVYNMKEVASLTSTIPGFTSSATSCRSSLVGTRLH
jgi:hypothetical protein